jgi:mRNA interferase MazF
VTYNDTAIVAGAVYRIAFHGKGYELTGPHYGVVVSDGAFNDLSTVVVIPFSSGARRYSWRVPVMIRGTESVAMIDQIRVVDKTLLREKIGILPEHALTAIRMELAEFLGLTDLPLF